MQNNPIRIYIVDDHPLIRSGLQYLIEDQNDITLLGSADNIANSVQEILQLKPDIVLLDLHLQNDEIGFEIIDQLQPHELKTQFIILTSVINPESIRTSISKNIASYLLKSIPHNLLLEAIRATHKGGTFIDPNVAKILIENIKATGQISPTDRLKTLSPQELRILKLITNGLTNKEIATRMSLSEKTIKNYFSNALGKLNLSRRAEAAAFYARNIDSTLD